VAKQRLSSSGRWYSRAEMAALWSVTPNHFDAQYRRFVPKKLIRKNGRRIEFAPESVRAVHDALLNQERENRKLYDDDALLFDSGGSDDPGLRRLRMAKAELAELDLQKKRGEIVFLEDVHGMFTRFASLMRRGMGQLGKRFGRDAQQLAEGVVDTAANAIERDLINGGDDASTTR